MQRTAALSPKCKMLRSAQVAVKRVIRTLGLERTAELRILGILRATEPQPDADNFPSLVATRYSFAIGQTSPRHRKQNDATQGTCFRRSRSSSGRVLLSSRSQGRHIPEFNFNFSSCSRGPSAASRCWRLVQGYRSQTLLNVGRDEVRICQWGQMTVSGQPERCCQTNSNQSPQGQQTCPLCCTKRAPLGEGSGAVLLEVVSTGEAAFCVEEVID